MGRVIPKRFTLCSKILNLCHNDFMLKHAIIFVQVV